MIHWFLLLFTNFMLDTNSNRQKSSWYPSSPWYLIGFNFLFYLCTCQPHHTINIVTWLTIVTLWGFHTLSFIRILNWTVFSLILILTFDLLSSSSVFAKTQHFCDTKEKFLLLSVWSFDVLWFLNQELAMNNNFGMSLFLAGVNLMATTYLQDCCQMILSWLHS